MLGAATSKGRNTWQTGAANETNGFSTRSHKAKSKNNIKSWDASMC